MSHASENSRRLPYREFHGTVRLLRVKETPGPVPTVPAGGCGTGSVVPAIPGVIGGSPLNISEWMQKSATPQVFNAAVKSVRKVVGPQR
jgi:hypothetical protein